MTYYFKGVKVKVSEAKTKVCPFIAEMGEDASGYTRFSMHKKCICSECMAWQFTDEYSDIPEVDYETEQGYCKRLSK